MNLQKNLLLNPDEQIVKIVRQYGLIHFWKVLVFSILVLADFFFMFWLLKQGYWGVGVFAIVLIAAFILGLRWLIMWRNNIFAITNYRIIDFEQKGMFTKNVSETMLFKVLDVSYQKKGIMQTLFRYGNVILQIAGNEIKIIINNIKNPQEIHRLLVDLINEEQPTNKSAQKIAEIKKFDKNEAIEEFYKDK